jgi:hypothetical protein
MKVTFRKGCRYRVRLQVPVFISPCAVLEMLKGQLSGVVLGEATRRRLVAEATWTGSDRIIDSEFLLAVDRLT